MVHLVTFFSPHVYELIRFKIWHRIVLFGFCGRDTVSFAV